jgi:hypothetical protein
MNEIRATPSRPLRELTDDELEFIRLTSEGPMSIPFELKEYAERLRALVEDEQARR